MTDFPQIFHRAASFDWETVIPVIFFILYGIAQFLGAKKKGSAGQETEEGEPDIDMEERARRIREEIRRRIEERRRAEDPAEPAAATAARGLLG